MDSSELTAQYKVTAIAPHLIFVDETFNCRLPFTAQSVVDFAKEIAETKLDYPLTVQPAKDVLNIPSGFTHRLIAGHRRYAALKLLKWELLPCYVEEGLSEFEARRYNLRENIARQGLSLMEEARGLRALYPKGTAVTKIAEEMHHSRGWVKVRLDLLDMPQRIRDDAHAGILTQQDIARLARLPDSAKLEILDKLYRDKELYGKPGKRVSLRTTSPRRHRTKTEIENMLVEIAKWRGDDFDGRYCLMWAAGNLSDDDLRKALDSLDSGGILEV